MLEKGNVETLGNIFYFYANMRREESMELAQIIKNHIERHRFEPGEFNKLDTIPVLLNSCVLKMLENVSESSFDRVKKHITETSFVYLCVCV